MINYLINQEGKKLIAMVTSYHRLERIAFVFTKRTGVRLGRF